MEQAGHWTTYAQQMPLKHSIFCLKGVGLSYTNKSLPRGARYYTISCFTHNFLLPVTLRFSYDQYKAALVFMKLYDTYLLSGFTNICNTLQSCSELVRNTVACYPIYQQLSEKGWHDVWVVWNIVPSRDRYAGLVGVFFVCLLLIHHSQSWYKILQSLSFKWLKLTLKLSCPTENIFCYSAPFQFAVTANKCSFPSNCYLAMATTNAFLK